jgi:hypothetical protein
MRLLGWIESGSQARRLLVQEDEKGMAVMGRSNDGGALTLMSTLMDRNNGGGGCRRQPPLHGKVPCS